MEEELWSIYDSDNATRVPPWTYHSTTQACLGSVMVLLGSACHSGPSRGLYVLWYRVLVTFRITIKVQSTSLLLGGALRVRQIEK